MPRRLSGSVRRRIAALEEGRQRSQAAAHDGTPRPAADEHSGLIARMGAWWSQPQEERDEQYDLMLRAAERGEAYDLYANVAGDAAKEFG
jgi:hypothetical protein